MAHQSVPDFWITHRIEFSLPSLRPKEFWNNVSGMEWKEWTKGMEEWTDLNGQEMDQPDSGMETPG